MKTLIFSDTHLTTTFKHNKYQFLEKIISSSDQVIIAGDFWEGKLISFDEFVNSEWKRLFPLLKKKRTVYVFGNHDKKSYSDKRVSLFSDNQTELYEFKDKDNIFFVKHGDSKKIKYSLIKVIVKTTHMSEKFFMKHFHEDLEHVLTKIFGPWILQLLFKKYNTTIKTAETKKLKENEYLICGHTHAIELDLKNHFINTGIIRHGIGEYATITDGKIKLHEERY